MSNVQCQMTWSSVLAPSLDLGLGTLDLGRPLAAGDVAAGIGASRFERC